MAAPVLRWGVLGSGWIAERFVGSLQRHTSQRLLAVGSRDAGRAAAFAGRYESPPC
jgi:predicted dehydrogenase